MFMPRSFRLNSRPLFFLIWPPGKAVLKNSEYGASDGIFRLEDVQGIPRKSVLWLGFRETFLEANPYQLDKWQQLLVS